MRSVEIDQLIREHRLVRRCFGDADVARFWTSAAASFIDAHAAGLSRAGALHLAYTAALRTSVAVLAVHGLGVTPTDDDRVAFEAAGTLDGGMGRSAQKLLAVRLSGERSIWEPDEDEEEVADWLGQAISTLRETLPAIRAEILSARPALAHSLPLPDSCSPSLR